tara:strand:- start:2441 stop:2917 length:477 start_codon:yes stop_codon:yes gene_type:complete
MFNEEQLKTLKISKLKTKLKKLDILDEYMQYDKVINYSKLNPQQHYLFKRVLHGLKMYTKDEIDRMHWDKKRRVIKVWKRSQDVINKWKQWVAYTDSKKIFSIFTNSKLGKELYEMPFEYMPDFKNKLTLKECGIEYEHLIIKFITEGLLPKNYFNIK